MIKPLIVHTTSKLIRHHHYEWPVFVKPIQAVVFSLSLLILSPATEAAVYKYVDKEGNVVFTNVPVKGAVPLKLNPLTVVSSQASNTIASSSHTASGSRGFPTVEPAQQKQRDLGRRKILEQELNNEQQALMAAQKTLEDGKAVRNGDETRNYQKYLNRIQKLQDTVTDHQKNVDALKKELGNG